MKYNMFQLLKQYLPNVNCFNRVCMFVQVHKKCIIHCCQIVLLHFDKHYLFRILCYNSVLIFKLKN